MAKDKKHKVRVFQLNNHKEMIFEDHLFESLELAMRFVRSLVGFLNVKVFDSLGSIVHSGEGSHYRHHYQPHHGYSGYSGYLG